MRNRKTITRWPCKRETRRDNGAHRHNRTCCKITSAGSISHFLYFSTSARARQGVCV